MKDKAFIDTNIFIYLYSSDEQEKKALCISEIKKFKCVTSTQALNELSNVFTRRWKLQSQDISNVINEISLFCEISLIEIKTIDKALALHDKYGFSYYDCLMLASALLCGCKYILSEDMQHNQKIDDALQIVNIIRNTNKDD